MNSDQPKELPVVDLVFHAVKRYVNDQNQKPALIVMHPDDIDSIRREMHLARFSDPSKDLYFMGIKVMRSFDTEPRKPVIA
jgi:hypothetical protein